MTRPATSQEAADIALREWQAGGRAEHSARILDALFPGLSPDVKADALAFSEAADA